MKRSYLAIAVILLVLIADQALKIWVKTHFQMNEEISLLGLNWAKLHFTENEGMAFGVKFGGDIGKLLLTLFRIVAVGFIGYYLNLIIKQKAPKGLVISIALIFAGAVGNIIDSIFYGAIFTDSFGRVAEMFPEEGGYAPLLYGHVVDMLYFPLVKGYYPDWMPLLSGKYFAFFRPVFNLADSSITIGVLSILFFQRGVLAPKNKKGEEPIPGKEIQAAIQETEAPDKIS